VGLKTNNMKEFIQKYQKAIVGTGALSVLLICYYQQKELTKLRSEQVKVYNVPEAVNVLQSTIDSLNSEAFILQTQIGRYELSLEHLYEVNPKAGKQFDEYLNNETE
jgi:phage terminase large subunit GpA-like protein